MEYLSPGGEILYVRSRVRQRCVFRTWLLESAVFCAHPTLMTFCTSPCQILSSDIANFLPVTRIKTKSFAPNSYSNLIDLTQTHFTFDLDFPHPDLGLTLPPS